MTAWFRSGLEDKKPRELSCPDARGTEILVQNFSPAVLHSRKPREEFCPVPLSSPSPSVPHHTPEQEGGSAALYSIGMASGRAGWGCPHAVLSSCHSGEGQCCVSPVKLHWAPSPHAFEDLEFGIWVRWGVGVMRDLQGCRHCCCYKPSVRWHSSFLWLQASFFSLLTLIPWDTRPLVLPCVLCAGEEGLFFRKGLRKAVVFEILRKPIQSS